jgi:hypothetical protein
VITLTFCRLFPKALGDRVKALVQTTYTNPVRTTNMAGLFTALERPVIQSLFVTASSLLPAIGTAKFEFLLMYLASWKAQTRKSIGRANFTTNSKRLSNGMIWRKYPIARVINK